MWRRSSPEKAAIQGGIEGKEEDKGHSYTSGSNDCTVGSPEKPHLG